MILDMTADIVTLLPPPTPRDTELEKEILAVSLRLEESTNPLAWPILAEAQRRLIALRSPAQVVRMEAQKGLR
jgi:hypothetical protein